MAANIHPYNNSLVTQMIADLEQVIGEAVEEAARRAREQALSHGEKVRPQLAARAICHDAHVGFLDELNSKLAAQFAKGAIALIAKSADRFFDVTLRDRAIAILKGSA